jgi:hypothetical protein
MKTYIPPVISVRGSQTATKIQKSGEILNFPVGSSKTNRFIPSKVCQMSVCPEAKELSTNGNEAPRQIHCGHECDDLHSCTVIHSILRQVFETLSQIVDLLLDFRRFELVMKRQRIANLQHVNTGSIGSIAHLPGLSDFVRALSRLQYSL